MRRAASVGCLLAIGFASSAAVAQPFTYNPPGQLVAGSGEGAVDFNVYAPGMRFPIEVAPAYANSQVWGNGGMNGPGGGQCDAVNYSYPWFDNFCETRSWTTPMCPSGEGHQGQDIRPSTCDKDVHWTVAADDGTITNIGTYSLALTTSNGTRHNYLHMEPSSIVVSVGDTVQRGDRIGRVSNAFGGTPTTIHLHYEIRQNISGIGDTPVPPYISLVASYEELLGVAAAPCAVIPPEGGTLDDSGPCARFYGPPASWRNVTEAGTEGNLHWTYAFDDTEPGNWAQWLSHFEEAGDYEVEVYVLAAYAQSEQARYVIRHEGQETAQTLDMSAAEGWRSLGSFHFGAEGDQFVAVYDNTGEALSDQRMIMFDAVRFTRQYPPEPVPEAGNDVAVDVDVPDIGSEEAGEEAGAAPPPRTTFTNDEAEGCACSAVGARRTNGGVIALASLLAASMLTRKRRRRVAR
jgi:Peptidase family M23